jgi:hypothetical protein
MEYGIWNMEYGIVKLTITENLSLLKWCYTIYNTARPSSLKNVRVGFLFCINCKMLGYNKPLLTFEDQLELLKSRGLEVANDTLALEYLHRFGYYRFSGYWYPLRKLLPLIDQQTKLVRPWRSDEFV